MHTIKSKISYFVVGTCLILSLQGCDQVNKLVNYFSGKDKDVSSKPKAPAPMEVKSVAVTTPAGVMKPKAPAVEAAKVQTPEQAPADLPDGVLAKVGTWSISFAEFKEQEKSAQELAEQNNLQYDLPAERLLGMIVEQQLLFQEAQRQGMDRDEKISKQIEEARKLILSQNLQTKLVEGVSVTDEEIKEFYEQNKQFYYEPAEYKISQIVVDTEEQANTILSQIAQGTNFAEVVSNQSKIKDDGNFITEDKLAFQKLKDIINTLDVGKFSAVFNGPQGFYIVKIDEKKGGKERTLEEVKDGIKADLSYLKYLQSLQKLQGEIPVQTNLKLLEVK